MDNHRNGDLELTHRELQILELVAQGYSAKEVAQEIDIAPRTVEGHIDTIRLKLRARNRAHMVAKAIAADVLTTDGHQKGNNGIAKGKSLRTGSKDSSRPELFFQPATKLVEQNWHFGANITRPTALWEA